MSDDKLKSLAERIENLMDERDGIQSDIRDIYVEAKGVGYVPKVLRKAITRKRMDASKRDEEDSILELYEGALSGPLRKAVEMAKAGASSHKIEQATGIDHSTVARSVALNKKSATEIIDDPAFNAAVPIVTLTAAVAEQGPGSKPGTPNHNQTAEAVPPGLDRSMANITTVAAPVRADDAMAFMEEAERAASFLRRRLVP